MKIVDIKTAMIGHEIILRVVTDAGIDVSNQVFAEILSECVVKPLALAMGI